MIPSFLNHSVRVRCLSILCIFALVARGQTATSWKGTLVDDTGNPVGGAIVRLHSPTGKLDYTARTSATGTFSFDHIGAGDYQLSASKDGKTWATPTRMVIKDRLNLTASLQISPGKGGIHVMTPAEGAASRASGGESLSSQQVSSLPLNEHDFSKLLLLAAGTMTDTNGSANFTPQFAVNGQRATATIFAIDGINAIDPEMGGATFPNFNVDAIQEVQESTGVMPAEIGHGAAAFTLVRSKSGTNELHGSAFEFVRNAAFDARNFFDRKNVADERRIPPFARNEFGFTAGGS